MFLNDVTGHLVVLMAPSGSGKGTLIRYLMRTFPQLMRKVSCTTRPKRPSEVDGREYHFLTKEEFKKQVDEDAFIEWAEFGGHLYGTRLEDVMAILHDKKVMLAEIELQGVIQLLSTFPRTHLTIIYIEAGDWEVLKSRVLARAPMSEEELALRYERYLAEREAKSVADVVIDNTHPSTHEAEQQCEAVIKKILETI